MAENALKKFRTKQFIFNPKFEVSLSLSNVAEFVAEKEILGHGAFGIVYLVTHSLTNRRYVDN